MAYPSIISVLANPAPTDRLNSPSHSTLHDNENDGITEIQRFVGLTSGATASAVGTVLYDVRSPLSDGGGHIQSANKGGTGQTAYTKGDLLVATSASVLAKFAVGADAQILQADSATAAGIKWAANSPPKIAVSGSVQAVTNTTTETSVLSVTVPGSVLGSNNAVRATLYVGNLSTNTLGDTLRIRGNYGTSSVSTLLSSISGLTAASVTGTIHLDLIAANATNAQQMMLRTDLFPPITVIGSVGGAFKGMKVITATTANQDSGAAQTLGLTATWNATATDDDFNTIGYIVEKLI